ncbi:MAG: peptide deformylase [Coriobacteriia bacterium]|nr:peptide deformylase [Coriobacteriia bacterium]
MRILSHPNPVLKQRAEEVDPPGDASLGELAAEMGRTMREAPGVGLAAPQIGVLKRVIVFDVDERVIAMCNPVVVERSEDQEVDEEGCLSLPGITVPVPRSVHVACEGLTVAGKPVRIEGQGLLARVLQHEIDHLDGTLILDRASPEDRKAALRRYNELCASAEAPAEGT